MADTEVENILREIRERVYAEQEALASHSTGVNGGGTSQENAGLQPAESLPRLESYLTTTARAWDRLPPVISNRSGATARLELWLKRQFKRATRWYAWEQVNFNAAVHHALGDIAQLLSSHEKTIEHLREERETRQAELQQLIAEQRRTIDNINARGLEVDGRLAETINELREATARLQDEQRVSFKQLALETSEAAVLEDRARRKTEALLEQLQQRVKQLEK